MENIQKMYRKAKEYGDEKVNIAIQTYEMVDKHIRRLDSDLAKFEAEMREQGGRLSQTETEDELDNSSANKKKKVGRKPLKEEKGSKKRKKDAEDSDKGKIFKSRKVTKLSILVLTKLGKRKNSMKTIFYFQVKRKKGEELQAKTKKQFRWLRQFLPCYLVEFHKKFWKCPSIPTNPLTAFVKTFPGAK